MVLLLQYELWFTQGGVKTVHELRHDIDAQLKINGHIEEKNDVLIADIRSLRTGNQAIEEHARNDLGMVKRGEIFYQVSS